MSVAAAVMLPHFVDASFLHGSSYQNTRLHYLPPLESLLVVDEEGSRRRQLKVG
jgi:hypothetical protein